MRTVGLLKNGKVAQVTDKAAKAEKPKKANTAKGNAAKDKAEKPKTDEQKPEDPATNEGNDDPKQQDAAKDKAETTEGEGE